MRMKEGLWRWGSVVRFGRECGPIRSGTSDCIIANIILIEVCDVTITPLQLHKNLPVLITNR